jgi:hypothetical protein
MWITKKKLELKTGEGKKLGIRIKKKKKLNWVSPSHPSLTK